MQGSSGFNSSLGKEWWGITYICIFGDNCDWLTITFVGTALLTLTVVTTSGFLTQDHCC